MECFYVVYIYESTCGAEGLIGYELWIYIVILILDIHRVLTSDMLKKVIYYSITSLCLKAEVI